MWFLIISENNLPGPQQQSSKGPFDLTPRTNIPLSENVKHLFSPPLTFHNGVRDTMAKSRRCGGRDPLWKRSARRRAEGRAALTETTNALCVSFSNATPRSVEEEGGSGQSRGSRAAQMGAPVSSQRKSGEGQRSVMAKLLTGGCGSRVTMATTKPSPGGTNARLWLIPNGLGWIKTGKAELGPKKMQHFIEREIRISAISVM